MLHDIERFSYLWADPERYVLVETGGPAGEPQHFWFDLARRGIWTFDYDESVRQAVIRRMLAAGVATISEHQLREIEARPQWSEADPQHVAPPDPVEAHHVRLSDGRFQRVFAGPDQSLFCGSDHILACEALSEVLLSAPPPSIRVIPAVVYDPGTGADRSGYFEVLPANELTPRLLRKRLHQDATVWHYQREHLFVSPTMREAILGRGFPDLRISAGFSALRNVPGDW